MKIEIDLNDILGDESGAETLHDSVRRQVVDGMTAAIKKGVGEQINLAVAKTIQVEIEKYVETEMPKFLSELMDTKYMPVDRWGDRQREKTTFRKQLVAAIHENMVYKKANYESDKNVFTKAVDEVISQNVAAFKVEFGKQVDANVVAQTMQYATDTLKKKLGLA